MGISNYSKYIDVLEYFLPPIVYIRFCVCLNSNKLCLFMRIGLRLSTVDPIMETRNVYDGYILLTTEVGELPLLSHEMQFLGSNQDPGILGWDYNLAVKSHYALDVKGLHSAVHM